MVTAEDDSSLRDAAGPPSDGGSGPHHGTGYDTAYYPEPRDGVLVVRAWVEPGEERAVRARMLTTLDDDTTLTTWATAAGDDAICEEFLRWLHRLEESATSGGRRAHPPPAGEEP